VSMSSGFGYSLRVSVPQRQDRPVVSVYGSRHAGTNAPIIRSRTAHGPTQTCTKWVSQIEGRGRIEIIGPCLRRMSMGSNKRVRRRTLRRCHVRWVEKPAHVFWPIIEPGGSPVGGTCALRGILGVLSFSSSVSRACR